MDETRTRNTGNGACVPRLQNCLDFLPFPRPVFAEPSKKIKAFFLGPCATVADFLASKLPFSVGTTNLPGFIATLHPTGGTPSGRVVAVVDFVKAHKLTDVAGTRGWLHGRLLDGLVDV